MPSKNHKISTPTGPAPVGLAPMEGVTEFATRMWFHLVSRPSFSSTPFLRVTGTHPKKIPEFFLPEATFVVGREPVTPQLMAATAEDFVRVAEKLLANPRVQMIEVNCGCPAPLSVGGGAGAGLLEQPDRFKQYLEFIASRIGASRLSVKTRSGFNDPKNFTDILAIATEINPARFVLHGRTKRAGYTGACDWSLIERAAAELSGTVIGSGDIVDLLTWRRAQERSVAATIIGRGALRNPWIFEDIREAIVLPVPLEVIKHSLCVLGCLYELEAFHKPFFRNLLTTCPGLTNSFLGRDANTWQDYLETLAHRTHTVLEWQHTIPSVSRPALGRIKMLWNYMRSSLPEPFFAPRAFRARTLVDFLNSFPDGIDSVRLLHNIEHDWIYSGAGKTNQSRNTSRMNQAASSWGSTEAASLMVGGRA